MSKKNSNKIVVYRDSITGQFVKQAEAKQRPKTTEKQHVSAPKKKK